MGGVLIVVFGSLVGYVCKFVLFLLPGDNL